MRIARVRAHAFAVTLALSVTVASTQTPAELTYTAFVQLPAGERVDDWNRTTPEVRSRLAQAHATAWMTAHEKRLSPAQIANLKEAIALLTPEFYRNPESPAMMAQSAELERKVMCTVWKSEAVVAFRPLGKSIPVTWTDDVFTWLKNATSACEPAHAAFADSDSISRRSS